MCDDIPTHLLEKTIARIKDDFWYQRAKVYQFHQLSEINFKALLKAQWPEHLNRFFNEKFVCACIKLDVGEMFDVPS